MLVLRLFCVCFVFVLCLFYVSFVLVDCLLSSVIECARLFRALLASRALYSLPARLCFLAHAQNYRTKLRKNSHICKFSRIKMLLFCIFSFLGLSSVFPQSFPAPFSLNPSPRHSQPISAPFPTRFYSIFGPFSNHYQMITAT